MKAHSVRSLRWLAILVATAMLVPISAPVTFAEKAPPPDPGDLGIDTESTSSSDALVDARVSDSLQDRLEHAATLEKFSVAVVTDKDAPTPAELQYPLKVDLRAAGDSTYWVGKVRADKLVKLATGDGVQFVLDNGRAEPPVLPDVERPTVEELKARGAEGAARVKAATEAGVVDEFRAQFDDDGVPLPDTKAAEITGLTKDTAAAPGPPAEPDGDAATGWRDVSADGHDSEGAWDLGYTGDGVRVAVADDSLDFAHPDLQGTQAVVDDPTSPYYGWPMAYDPFSNYILALDRAYGTSFVADGESWYSDTSADITAGSPVFREETYTLPGTSVSGTYKIGYLWDENLYMFWYADYPAVLVADENASGVYDTVYVDLNYNQDFTDDKPCTKASPISYLDDWTSGVGLGSDGYADFSGGMVYWVADGVHNPPGYDPYYTVYGTPEAPGELVCFMGALDYYSDHGTLCGSNVAGQGVIDGESLDGDYPAFKTTGDGTPGTGMVEGAGKDVELVGIADIYNDHIISTLIAWELAAFGTDDIPGSGDEIQVVSNSYGSSDTDNDEWDWRSRYCSMLNNDFNPNVSYLFSTGNGAPGYGTNAPPTPSTGISIGASTQMGACGGWDSIVETDQVTVGDVIPWSNRGPTAMGRVAPHVVADGAYSSGAEALNLWGDGWTSWFIWGGTSRSAPVAAGNLALIYQAYYATNGTWPDWQTARNLLMSSANDLSYDTLVQGAGMVDAKRGVELAAELDGVRVSPSAWYPGPFTGSSYGHAITMAPGETDITDFGITNHGSSAANIDIEDTWYRKSGTVTLDIDLDGADESTYDFNRPDWLYDITPDIPAGTDLMVVRAVQDFEDFAPTGAFDLGTTTHNAVRLLAYDWEDQDISGTLWDDTNANGAVNTGEIDAGEYMRFTYDNNFGNTHEVRVQNPLERMHDGVFLGLQHNTRATADNVANVHIEVEFWDREDMPWLTLSTDNLVLGAGIGVDIDATMTVPPTAVPGTYEGQIRVDDGTDVTVVPVVVSVAADGSDFEFGDIPGAVTGTLLDNTEVYGAQSWGWRAESGDWRFLFADTGALDSYADGTKWLVHTTWDQAAAGQESDIDSLVFGPTEDEFSDGDLSFFGPYTLEPIGGSDNTNTSYGIWLFDTATGGAEEWVSADLRGGLNEIALHNVVHSGEATAVAFSGETGTFAMSDTAIEIVSKDTGGSLPLDGVCSLPLPGVGAAAFGLGKTLDLTGSVSQGGDWTYSFPVTNGALIEATCGNSGGGSDIDLFLERWTGSVWQEIAVSESASDAESVRVTMPADGTYRIRVYGFSVVGSSDTFDASLKVIQGTDLSVAGLPAGSLAADEPFDFTLNWSKDRTALADRLGTYEGVLFVGPSTALSAVEVPVSLRYPFEVESATPAADSTAETDAAIEVTLSKQAAASSVSGNSFYLTETGSSAKIAASVSYTDSTATMKLTPSSALAGETDYTVHVVGIASKDGDSLSDSWSFTTAEAVVLPLTPYDRLAGATRYDTAVEISQEAFDASDVVVLASGENFPDALAASGLAGAFDAPLLLTRRTVLPAGTAAEIARLGASRVIVIGGTGAVSSSVAAAVDALAGVNAVERIGGATRYDTAAMIAARIKTEMGAGFEPTAFLCRGDNYADAVAASPLSFAGARPILLTPSTTLAAPTSAAITSLGITDVVVCGGTGAVSPGAAGAAAALPGVSAIRVFGSDRYGTAASLAEYGVNQGWASWAYVGVATGQNFPDALAGGVGCGSQDGVLLLTRTATLSPVTQATLAGHAAAIDAVRIIGGTGAIAESVAQEIKTLLGF